MPRVAKRPPGSGKKSSGKKSVPLSKLRVLREQAKIIRQQVAQDREQITAEARQAVDDAVQDGKLTKLTVLFRPDEQKTLQALDQYGLQHGLKSREQVVRAAIFQLLNIDVDQRQPGN